MRNNNKTTKYGPGFVSRQIDYRKKTTVDLFKPVYGGKQDFKHKVFSFEYEPILSEMEINMFYLMFPENRTLVDDLVNTYSTAYFHNLQSCHIWYRSVMHTVIDSFIESYMKKEETPGACPIIRFVNIGHPDNVYLKTHLLDILNYCKDKGITTSDRLISLHDCIGHDILREYMHGFMNSVDNITYMVFGKFLREEMQSQYFKGL